MIDIFKGNLRIFIWGIWKISDFIVIKRILWKENFFFFKGDVVKNLVKVR